MMFKLDFDVMSIDETLDYIIDKGASIARFGDGEIACMYYLSISFQKHNLKLAKELRKVYTSREQGLLVCVPEALMTTEALSDKARKWWDRNLNAFHRFLWSFRVDRKNYRFGNSFLTRTYTGYTDNSFSSQVFSRMKHIWDKREVLIVEGAKSRVGIGNDLLDSVNSIERILGPAKNAYGQLGAIESYIVEHCSTDKLIILALGPAATVLVYRLHQRGYQVLDMGHFDIEYELMLLGATEMVAIKNKYTNEAADGDVVSEDFIDDVYMSQIVADFSR